jgi:hypothetical protein
VTKKKPPCESCGASTSSRRFFLGKVFRLCTSCAMSTSQGLGLVVTPKTKIHPHGTYRDRTKAR